MEINDFIRFSLNARRHIKVAWNVHMAQLEEVEMKTLQEIKIIAFKVVDKHR